MYVPMSMICCCFVWYALALAHTESEFFVMLLRRYNIRFIQYSNIRLQLDYTSLETHSRIIYIISITVLVCWYVWFKSSKTNKKKKRKKTSLKIFRHHQPNEMNNGPREHTATKTKQKKNPLQ